MPTGLIIKNVNNDDDGIYKCSASVLSTGEEVEEDIDVKVSGKETLYNKRTSE